MITNEEIENEVKRLSKLSTAPDKDTPDWMESDIRNGIKAGILLQQNKVSDEEKDRIIKLKDNYIKELDELLQSRASEIRHLQNCLNKHKNKVSDVSADDNELKFWKNKARIASNEYLEVSKALNILQKHSPDFDDESGLYYRGDSVLKIMQEYASIVNERKDNVEINAINFAEWLELEGFRIKGMDDTTRGNVYRIFKTQSQSKK